MPGQAPSDRRKDTAVCRVSGVVGPASGRTGSPGVPTRGLLDVFTR
jgi:hypothetical protein